MDEPISPGGSDHPADMVSVIDSIAQSLDINCIYSISTAVSMCIGIKGLGNPVRSQYPKTGHCQRNVRVDEKICGPNYCSIAIPRLESLACDMQGNERSGTCRVKRYTGNTVSSV